MDDIGFGGSEVRSPIGLRAATSADRRVASRNRSRRPSTYKGVTDATGTHYLQLNFDGEKPDLPVMVSANASVTDVNRQSFASNLELLVHPSTLYVGIRSTRQFVREGEPIDVEAIVTDIDGKRRRRPHVHDHRDAGRVHVRERHVGRHRRRSQALRRDVVDEAGVVFRSRPGIGGQYKISAVVADDAGGKNRSEFTRWVSGAETVPTRDVEQESATVVPEPGALPSRRHRASCSSSRRSPTATGCSTVSANGTTTDAAVHASSTVRRSSRCRSPTPYTRGTHRASRPRRPGAETARRRNEGSRSSRRVPPSRPHRFRCTSIRRTQTLDGLRGSASPRHRTRRARHGRRLGQGRRRRRGRRRRCCGRRRRRSRACR